MASWRTQLLQLESRQRETGQSAAVQPPPGNPGSGRGAPPRVGLPPRYVAQQQAALQQQQQLLLQQQYLMHQHMLQHQQRVRLMHIPDMHDSPQPYDWSSLSQR